MAEFDWLSTVDAPPDEFDWQSTVDAPTAVAEPIANTEAPGGMADSLRSRSGDDMPSEPDFDPDPMGMGNLYNPAGFGDVKEVDQQDYEADVIAQHRQNLARSAADQASLNRVEDINPLRRTIPVRAAEKLYEGVGGGGAGAVATGLGAAAEFVGADDTAEYFKGKAKQVYATMARRAGDQKMIGRTTSGDIPFSDEISSGLAAVGEAIAVTMATGGGAEAATLAAKAKAMIPFTTWFGAKAGAETLSETGDYTQAATSALIEGAWTLGGGMAGGGLARFAGVSSNALSRAAANAAAKVKLPKWTGEVLSGSAIEAMQEAGTEASHYWAEVGFGRRKWDRKEFIQRMKEAAGPALVAGGLGGAFGAYANRMADAFEKRQRIMPEEVGKADTAVKAAETILAEQPEVAKELSEVEGTPSRRQFEEITKDPGKTDVTHRETVVEEIRRQLETPTEPNIAEQNIEQKTEQPAEQPIAQPQSEEQVTEPITEQQTEQVVEQAEQFTEPFRLDPTPEPPAPPPVGENVPTRQPDLITDLWRESLPGQQGLFEGEKPEPPAESDVPDTGQDGWMDPKKIKLDPARFQFKAGHKETGEVRGNELTGTWNDAASGVILVWEDKNGEVYAVNGHHRVPHAQRHKVPRVRVSVLREADGVTPAQARSQGAIINILEGQGSVKDYADFAKSTDLTWEAAERAGLLGRQKGREGIAIGSLSTDDLYAAFRNTKISASKAAAIAEAAPKDARLQNLGLEIARRDKDLSAEEIKHSLKLAAAQAKAGPQAKQTDMFGYDDSAIQESIKITRAATKIVDALNDRRLAVEGALRRPEQAKEMGLSGDFESIQAEHAGLIDELARWKHWTTDPELYRRARQEAGLDPPESEGGNVAFAGLPPSLQAPFDQLLKAATQLSPFHDYRRSILNWSARNQKTSGEIHQVITGIRKAIPDGVRRDAITNWIQADGDVTLLQQRAAASKGRLAQGYLAATTLTPQEIAVAKSVRATYDVVRKRALAHGIHIGELDNYVNQIWRKQPLQRFFTSNNRRLDTGIRFAKKRYHESFFDGEQAGLSPQTKDISALLPIYINEVNNAISAKELVAELSQGKATDGRPLLAPTGAVNVVDGPTPDDKSFLVLPEMPEKDTGDYRVMEQPALHSWKWRANDTTGQPIYVKGDLRVHPEFHKKLKNVLGQSALREQSPSEHQFGDVPKAIAKFLVVVDDVQQYGKATMLGFLSPFHQVQEGTHAIGHRINPFFGLPEIDLSNPEQMDAAKHGLMLLPDRVSAAQFREGVDGSTKNIAANLIGLAGKPGQAIKGLADAYQHYLFHQYIPSLKYKTYEHMLVRNRTRYGSELQSGNVTLEQVKYLSAQQANAAYGHLNYADMGRDPTMQHIAQIALLAPDFLEARVRFSGQGVQGFLGKVGHEQLAALALLGGIQFVASRVLNKLLDDDYHWDHPFEVIVGNRRYRMRSVPEDMFAAFKDTRQFISGRLSPLIGRGTLEYLSGVNYRGEQTTPSETLTNLIGGMVPLMLQPMTRGLTETGRDNPVSPLEQLMGSLGLHVGRYSPLSKIYDLEREWLDEHGEEHGLDTKRTVYPASKYQRVRYALEDADDERVAAEIQRLVEEEKIPRSELSKRLKQSLTKPFTGTIKTDKAFRDWLDDDGKKLFDAAQKRQKLLLERFNKVKNTTRPVPTPPPAAAPPARP